MKKENKTQTIPPTQARKPFDQQEPDVQMKDWAPLQIDGPATALILPDIHLPYHDLQALQMAVEWGKQNKPSHVILNGDVADYYQISKFGKDPTYRHWVSEIELERDFFAWIREQFPKSEIIFKLGNHDERYEAFMQRNCAELIGLDTFELKNVLKLGKDIKLIGDYRPIRLGALNVIHGHEYRFAIANPVNPARGLFLRGKDYALCSHFHQKSEHTENTITGKGISTWSTGCLCQLRPRYHPLNNWVNGFAWAEVFNNNKFDLANRKISHGKIY